jgi:hypothetical protein
MGQQAGSGRLDRVFVVGHDQNVTGWVIDNADAAM